MQLVLVAHGGRAALQIGNIAVIVGHDERTLKLPGLRRVDAEIRRQLHGTAHPLGDVDKRAVGKHRRVQGRKVIVGIGHHTAQIAAHQVGIIAHRLADGAEYHAQLGQPLAVGGAHAHAVHDGIHGHSTECHALLQRDAQLVEGLYQLRVNLMGGRVFLLARGGIVAD